MTKFDITEYQFYKIEILKVYHEKGLEEASMVSAMSSIPFFASWYFIYEDTQDETVADKIKKLMNFYGYKVITCDKKDIFKA